MGYNYFMILLLLIGIQIIKHSFCFLQLKQLQNLTLQAIVTHPKVKIHISPQQILIQNFKRDCYAIKVFSKSKKQAYDTIQHKFQKIFQTLKNKVMVPDDPSFVTSKLYHRYLKYKKVWQFEKIFIVEGLQAQINYVSFDLLEKGARKIADQVDDHFMQQNSRIIKMFISARQLIRDSLSRFVDLHVMKGKIFAYSNIDGTQNQIKNSRSKNQQQSDSEQQMYDQINENEQGNRPSAYSSEIPSELIFEDLLKQNVKTQMKDSQTKNSQRGAEIVFSLGLLVDEIQIGVQKVISDDQSL